jgi:hypothetical protein
MQRKTKIIIAVVAVATAFATGRYTVPTKVIEVTKVVEVEKKTKDKDQKVDKDTKKTTTIVEEPTGKKTTTIVEEDKVNKDTSTKETDDKTKTDNSFKEVLKSSPLSVSALFGGPLPGSGPFQMVYGLHVSKQVLGPITVGAFGMTNRTVGFSLGLNF